MSYFLKLFQRQKKVLTFRQFCSKPSKCDSIRGGGKKQSSYGSMYNELFERCPKDQIKFLKKLHAKHKGYVNKVESSPTELPKISWDYYKANVSEDKIKMVEEFEEEYKKFKIPEPELPKNIATQLDEETRQTKEALEKYLKESCERIKIYEEKIQHLQSMVPYNQMTIEEYFEARPEDALDFINKPTFWPHFSDDSEPRK